MVRLLANTVIPVSLGVPSSENVTRFAEPRGGMIPVVHNILGSSPVAPLAGPGQRLGEFS